MSEERQQQEEAAIAAEESNDDWQDEQPVDDQIVEQVDEQAIAEILAEDEMIEDEFLSFGEEEDAESIRIITSEENLAEIAVEPPPEFPSELPDAAEDDITATREELKPVIEALLFVADEPLPFKQLCKVLGHVSEEDVRAALDELVADFEARESGLEVREIAGGWRISTRPQHHDFIRKYLKSRPTARLSLPALETLAVIAYKQPITIPEVLEIRGVSSTSAIKTLLEKRLIVTKGRKETVGRPMMYGTSKEFLIQFGLKDLTELPSIEDFEDLAQ